MFKKRKIYLDYAGAAPLNWKVRRKMNYCGKIFYANPNAIFKDGIMARTIIEKARGNIAKLINAHNDEIIFTGSGTESDALAILGTIRNWRNKNNNKMAHIITTKIEHPAVLENCRLLESMGEATVTYLGVDENGIINIEELKESIKEDTVLVSIMYANNEIGSIQPIMEIAKGIRYYKKHNSYSSAYPIFHTDACQAMNYLYTDNIEKLGVDLMTFNSSKIYGPKGIGALYKKRRIELPPLYLGGGQEFTLRSGTESVSLISGLSLAFSIVNKIKEKEIKRLIKIRDYGIDKILSLSNKFGFRIILNGGIDNRLPNNINISIFGISSELLVIELDALGIEVSEKSACHSKNNDDSYVIKAIRENDKTKEAENGSLRISLGRFTCKKDMDYLVSCLIKIMNKYNNCKHLKNVL